MNAKTAAKFRLESNKRILALDIVSRAYAEMCAAEYGPEPEWLGRLRDTYVKVAAECAAAQAQSNGVRGKGPAK